MYLRDVIIKLIESKQEDDYYDFKESWHENNAELLHDILSLANNRTDNDGLLIFGVKDATFNIIGVENDLQRKNQQNIIDFLNSKTFFAGIRPSIELHTIKYLKHEIDILIVKNTTDTPYYLSKEYRDRDKLVRENYIYTRIKDTNTPIDRSADVNQVEYLWKKRFKLNASPIIRIFDELKNKEHWKEKVSFKNSNAFYYNIYNPEYTVEVIPDEDYDNVRYEFYSYKQINHTTSYGTIIVKYYSTEIFTTQYVLLDGGRYITVVPEWSFPELGNKHEVVQYSYKCYYLDSYEYILKEFLYCENDNYRPAKMLLDECVLYFENKIQKLKFENYLSKFKLNIKKEIANEMKTYTSEIVYNNKAEDLNVKRKLACIKVYRRYYNSFVTNYCD